MNSKRIITACCLLAGLTAYAGGSIKNDKRMEVKHLTKSEFLEKVYDYEKNSDAWKFEGDKPALIDFYATWCGPCKMLAPVLEELNGEYAGTIDIYKIDVDQEQELAAKFGVRSIPTLVLIPKNGTLQIIRGALPKNELQKAIDTVLLDGEK